MIPHVRSLAIALLATSFARVTSAAKCDILFDGRVPLTTTPADFDTPSSLYNDQFVHGENQTWSEIIKFPIVEPSLFDVVAPVKPLEVTINDNSVFLPGSGGLQLGFRRSELIPAINNGTDPTTTGTTTIHWSIRNDPQRPLNLSHEYHPVWHETNDFSTDEFTFLTGTPFNASFESPRVPFPQSFRVAGRQSNSPETNFFDTAFEFDVWHNFAVQLGWSDNLISIFYSKGLAPLERVVAPVFNNNSGGGQVHFGVFKLPTGPLGIDVVHTGFQESGINEGLIYGGIFIEDSSNGCVTLSPIGLL